MLEYLRIQNLALIQDMELDFSPGLNVLTGESGAGKSFILRALDFILGEKLTSNMVRPGQERARVEALFVLDGEEYIIRRELVTETGRSRVFVNESLSGQEVIKSLAPQLLIHTSQHSQQRLLKPAFHCRMLDEFLPDKDIMERKQDLEFRLKEVQQKIDSIEHKCEDLEQRRELLEYQREEIAKVAPKPGEEEELLELKDQQKNLSSCQESIETSLDILSSPGTGLLDNVLGLQRAVQPLISLDQKYEQYSASLTDMRETLTDLEARLRSQGVADEESMGLEDIESRLFALADLRRRLKRSLEEIVDLQQEIDANLSFLDACKLDLKQLAKDREKLLEEFGRAVSTLNQARQQAAKTLKKQLEEQLHSLGFSEHVQIQFEFLATEVFPNIVEERPRLLWIPNPGQPPQPLDKIASGGELSRFLLALVSLRGRADLPTLLFDEVDAGIGGLILNQVGERISHLSRKQQVILITHWPQLASLADRHFNVSKEISGGETFTRCQRLDTDEIMEELGRMAGGGEHGLDMAKKLLDPEQPSRRQ